MTTSDLNVRDFGALGDDSTDDWLAIQSTLNKAEQLVRGASAHPPQTQHKGVNVTFPAGVYRISRPLRLRSDHVRLTGAGRHASILQASYFIRPTPQDYHEDFAGYILVVAPGFKDVRPPPPPTPDTESRYLDAPALTLPYHPSLIGDPEEQSLGFRGSADDAVILNDCPGLPSINGAMALTVEAFVQFSDVSTRAYVFGSMGQLLRGDRPLRQAFYLRHDARGAPAWGLTTNGPDGIHLFEVSSPAFTFVPNTVYHVALVYDSGRGRFDLYATPWGDPKLVNRTPPGAYNRAQGPIALEWYETVSVGAQYHEFPERMTADNPSFMGRIGSLRISTKALYDDTSDAPAVRLVSDPNSTVVLCNWSQPQYEAARRNPKLPLSLSDITELNAAFYNTFYYAEGAGSVPTWIHTRRYPTVEALAPESPLAFVTDVDISDLGFSGAAASGLWTYKCSGSVFRELYIEGRFGILAGGDPIFCSFSNIYASVGSGFGLAIADGRGHSLTDIHIEHGACPIWLTGSVGVDGLYLDGGTDFALFAHDAALTLENVFISTESYTAPLRRAACGFSSCSSVDMRGGTLSIREQPSSAILIEGWSADSGRKTALPDEPDTAGIGTHAFEAVTIFQHKMALQTLVLTRPPVPAVEPGTVGLQGSVGFYDCYFENAATVAVSLTATNADKAMTASYGTATWRMKGQGLREEFQGAAVTPSEQGKGVPVEVLNIPVGEDTNNRIEALVTGRGEGTAATWMLRATCVRDRDSALWVGAPVVTAEGAQLGAWPDVPTLALSKSVGALLDQVVVHLPNRPDGHRAAWSVGATRWAVDRKYTVRETPGGRIPPGSLQRNVQTRSGSEVPLIRVALEKGKVTRVDAVVVASTPLKNPNDPLDTQPGNQIYNKWRLHNTYRWDGFAVPVELAGGAPDPPPERPVEPGWNALIAAARDGSGAVEVRVSAGSYVTDWSVEAVVRDVA